MNREKGLKLILGVIFFGSLWGLSEATLGDWLYVTNTPHASILLTAISLVIVACARTFLPYRGSSSAIALVAIIFKLVNVPFFACHLWAILLFGVGFDISCELIPMVIPGRFRLPLLGLVSTYLGRTLFALTITYVWRYHYWTDVGFPKVLDYILISGSIAALLGAMMVPLGYRIGITIRDTAWLKLHPRIASTVLIAGTMGVWILQRLI